MLDFEGSVEKLVNQEVNRRLGKLLTRLNAKIGRGVRVAPKPNGAPAAAAKSKTAAKGKSRGRQEQARYMILVRHLPAKQKDEIRAIRVEKGIRAAIAAAKKLQPT